MLETKNDIVWQNIFNDYNIIQEINKNDHYIIQSKVINNYRESRLMTKFDHEANLPEIFKKNSLNILPVSRGSYIMGHFLNYKKINYQIDDNLIYKFFPSYIESINVNNLYSESAALSCADITGIIEYLINERVHLTVSGRMTTDTFDFSINTINEGSTEINVDRAQIEIDAGFECKNYFLLIEAKNITVEDFLIRQLYYPYRYWQNQLKKQVLPVFMTYSNDVFSFFIYKFLRENEYNSLELIQQKHYSIEQGKIFVDDIYDIFKNIKIVPEPEIPFPQADSFFRVIDFLGLLYNGDMTKEELALNYEFDIHKRQFDYYTNAALYLGLVEKYNAIETGETTFTLSQYGRDIMSKPRRKKILLLVESILKHDVFYRAMAVYFNKSKLPRKEEIVRIMRSSYLYNVESFETIKRRAQTVLKWIEWIVSSSKPGLFN
jgi:hypothetical protein